MKTRPIITIIGSALTLLLLFAALPALAQTSNSTSISNLTYDGVEHGQYMVLSWDIIANMKSVKLQVKGGGISNVWGTSNFFSTSTSANGARTVLRHDDLTFHRVGNARFKFRVKVKLTNNTWTPWAYVDES